MMVKSTGSVMFIIICLTHANAWELMGKPCSCTQFIKSHIFYYNSSKNSYQLVLQVMQKSVLGHVHVSECAMKSKVRMIKSLSPWYKAIPKNIARLLPWALVLMLHTRSNTNGNKLMIFSSIALYYGDTYIVSIFGITSVTELHQ